MLTNLRIISVEPSSVGPEETFQVEIAFEYSLEEATDFSVTVDVGQRRPFGLTRHDVIEFSDTKEIQLPVGVSTHTETFSFQLPESGLIDDGRFIDVSITDGFYIWGIREYNAVIFTGYIAPLPTYVGIIAGVAVGVAMLAFIVAILKGGIFKE